ncbi:MAG: YkgJ family cysteine cluster protein [Casimicrobiaceae bacterium]|nr:YkgJ family cysteine cluster protein [Casimicrobiaceae bacterium]
MSKKRYDCAHCPGYCCSYPYIEVTAADIRRLAAFHGLEESEATTRFTREASYEGARVRVLRHRKDHIYKSTCLFFDQEARRCTVYSARPRVCRAYPNGTTCGYYSFIRFERRHQGDDAFIPSA